VKFSVRRTDDEAAVEALHTLVFPLDEWEDADAMWLVWDPSGTPVGFCTARKLKQEDAVFLARAGVLPCARGHKLQRRLLQVRESWARKLGVEVCITYVLHSNFPSLANLIKSGYEMYKPPWKYAGDVQYLQKSLR